MKNYAGFPISLDNINCIRHLIKERRNMMNKLKRYSSLMSMVFVLQLILSGLFTNTVQAAVEYPMTFPKVESRPVKEAIRYKDKTIVLDHYVNYFDQVVDQPIKLIVEADGKKNIISEDVQLLRGFVFIGIRDDFAYFADDYNEGSFIYKVDLNNYTMQKTSESVNNYTKNINVNVNVRDAVIDTTGNKWFADDNPNWNFRDANGNLIENAPAFLVYNSLGKFTAYKISSRVITNYEGVGHITPGNDSDVWFTYSYIKDKTLNTRDNKIIRVTKDGALEEYPIDSNYYIDDIRVDKAGNVYLKGTNWIKEGYKMVKKEGIVMHYTFANGNLKHIQNYPVDSNYLTDMDLDANGNVWILYGAKAFKLENGTFNLKYYTQAKMNELSVYDDYNMATFCFDNGYTNITVQDTGGDTEDNGSTGEEPQPVPEPKPQPPNNNNGSEDNTPKPVSDILSNDKISKDKINEVSPTANGNSAEVKLDAANVKGGQGSLKLNINALTLVLPFGAVDYTGTEQGSYIAMKSSVFSNDSLLNNIKDIGKLFEFSLTTHKSDGTLIKDIHNFVSGKATISIKLTNEDISKLDVNKLAAFYYNESTKTWEVIGGTFNKDTMVFTFETSHFSKYTIAETNNVLPQTGSFADTTSLMILSAIIIAIGIVLISRKESKDALTSK